jgi:glycosyltransferase involved in cell wall biosynthesis
VDGNREGVVDAQTGFVIPPFDKAKLRHAIDRLVSDPSLRRSMGEAGRRFALLRFDASVMVDALERLYGNIVRRGSA